MKFILCTYDLRLCTLYFILKKMRFVKGEKVKFLNNVGGGVVTKVIDKNMVEVRTYDGFEYPVMNSELISIDEDIVNREYGFTTENDKLKEQEKLNNSTDDSEDELDEVEYEEEVYENETDDINLFFAFVPTETVIEKADFMTYLVNDSNYYVMFNIYSDSVGEFWNKHAIMEPNSKELLDTFANTKINELEKFSFQFLFFKNGKHDKKAAIQKDLKINVKNFFSNKKFIANDFFYEDSMILPLLTEDGMRDAMENLVKKDIEEALRIKLKSQNQEKALGFAKKIHPQNKENVIDLHIHELIDDERGFSRNELLDLQMKKFISELDSAIKKRIGRIVFIHGVGNGRLKMEIVKALAKPKYKKLNYQDASFKEYGYGATMIII